MADVVAILLASVITAPIIFYFFTYVITAKLTRSKRKAITVASDSSTLFFILAVYFIIQVTWNFNLFWIILMELLLTAVLFLVLQWQRTDDLELSKVLKGFWRFNFLVYGAGYFGLMIVGLIWRIVGIF